MKLNRSDTVVCSGYNRIYQTNRKNKKRGEDRYGSKVPKRNDVNQNYKVENSGKYFYYIRKSCIFHRSHYEDIKN